MNNTLFFNNIVANPNPVTTLTWNADLDCTIQYNVFAAITDWDWDAHLSPGFNNVTDYPNQPGAICD